MNTSGRLPRAIERIALFAAAAATGCHGSAATNEAAARGDRCASVAVEGGAVLDPDDAGCVALRFLPCGVPAGAQVDKCLLDVETCGSACAKDFLYCQLGPGSCTAAGGAFSDAAAFVECVSCPGAISGRRPPGLCAPSEEASPVTPGGYFASMAHLERASVRAFRDLAGWLAMHRAPKRLVRAALRAASDERRHGRIAARLSRRYGTVPPRVRVRRLPAPSLAALALDNAVEGCANETYGALLAAFQARHAGDPRIRRSLQRIAGDEVRHAELAWGVLAWALPRLTASERAGVRRAFDRALAALQERASFEVPLAARTVSGHPSRPIERLMLEASARLCRAEWRRRTRRTPRR